jgi:hypothetical protein
VTRRVISVTQRALWRRSIPGLNVETGATRLMPMRSMVGFFGQRREDS